MAVRTIKSSGGDYTSLSAWEAGTQGVFTEIETAECYDFEDTANVVIDGSTTTSSFYHRIVAAAGDEAQMPFSTSAYRLTSGLHTLQASDDFARIERIQVTTTSTNNARQAIRVVAEGVRVVGCVTRLTGAATGGGGILLAPVAATTCYAVNCVAIGNGAGSGYDTGGGAGAVSRFYNCTSIGWANGFLRTTRDAIAKNCLSHGNATADFSGTWASGTEYNASEDATAPGTNSRTSQTFTFVDAGNGDYHLASGDAGAKDFGVDLSADAAFPFSTDFDDAARSGSWDIGADEITAAGGAATVLPGVGAALFAGLEPTIQVPRNVLPGVGAGIFAGFAPSIAVPRNVLPGVGTATFAGFAPTVQAPRNVLPGLGVATFSGFAPVVSVSGSVVVQPGVGAATFTGFAPTLQVPRNVVAGFGEAVFAGLAPTWSMAAVPVVVVSPATGKYKPEHASARADLAGATGFASEHRSALSDLSDAGV